MTTTPEEALAAVRTSHQAAEAEVERLEKAIAAEQQRDKDSRQLHATTMAELKPALAAARKSEADWRRMLPRAPRTVTPTIDDPHRDARFGGNLEQLEA